jgi:hypothetical protein
MTKELQELLEVAQRMADYWVGDLRAPRAMIDYAYKIDVLIPVVKGQYAEGKENGI